MAAGVAARLRPGDAVALDHRATPVLTVLEVDLVDREAIAASVARTRRLLVVDEDYREFGLSGEVAAATLEAGLAPDFSRVCLEGTIPYARHLEDAALPSAERIAAAVRSLCG